MCLCLYVRCKKITVKEVLTLAHFDTELVVLMSPAVVSVLPDPHRKNKNKEKHKKHPNALCFMSFLWAKTKQHA